MAAGKGDRPRKVNGPKYRENYDAIKWKPKNPKPNEPKTKEATR
jgi:hypothetical protein